MVRIKNNNSFLRFLFFLLSLFFINNASAKTDSLPAFKMLMSNGSYFSAKDIPRNKAVLLIYFAPDCDHCHKLFQALFPKIKELKNAEIVLATFKPVADLASFENQYQTNKYPNLVVGTEGTSFYLRYYYKLTRTPFAAIYDKKGRLAYSSNNPSAREILAKYKTGTGRK